jgi:hypothetical protein
MGIIVYCIAIYQFLSGNTSLRRRDRYQINKRKIDKKPIERSLVQEHPIRAPIRRNYLGCIMTFLITIAVFVGGIYLLDLDLEIQPIVVIGISLFVASALGLFVLNYRRR